MDFNNKIFISNVFGIWLIGNVLKECSSCNVIGSVFPVYDIHRDIIFPRIDDLKRGVKEIHILYFLNLGSNLILDFSRLNPRFGLLNFID